MVSTLCVGRFRCRNLRVISHSMKAAHEERGSHASTIAENPLARSTGNFQGAEIFGLTSMSYIFLVFLHRTLRVFLYHNSCGVFSRLKKLYLCWKTTEVNKKHELHPAVARQVATYNTTDYSIYCFKSRDSVSSKRRENTRLHGRVGS